MGSRWNTFWLTMGVLLSLFGEAAIAARSTFTIPPQELAELASLTSQKVPEIQRARRLAQAKYAFLAAYGSTSRELLYFVLEKSEQLGSRDGYRLWLADQESVPLYLWHRPRTALEFLLIPKAKNHSSERKNELSALRDAITKDLASTLFYDRLTIQMAQEIGPELDRAHYEAIQHIPISERGWELLPNLNVHVAGKEVNLADWGLRQFSSRALVFQKNAAPGILPEPNAPKDFQQVLRWIGFESSHPGLEVPEASKVQVRELFQSVRRTPGAGKLLRGQTKVTELLESIQNESPDPLRTRRLFDEYGISSFARESGALALLRLPLPNRPDAFADGEHPAEVPPLYARVRLADARLLSEGALWIEAARPSEGRPEGFFTSVNLDPISPDETYLQVTLNPEAIDGVDYVRYEDFWVLKTREAIAKIAKAERDYFVQNQMERLRALKGRTSEGSARDTALRTLGSMLDPLRNQNDAKLFREVWELGGGDRRANQAFLGSFFLRPEMLRESFHADDAFWRALVSRMRMEADDTAPGVAAVKAYSISESPTLAKAIPFGAATRVELLQYPPAMETMREKTPEFWTRVVNALVTDGAYTPTLLTGDLNHPAEIAFLRALAARSEGLKGLNAPVLTPNQASTLEIFAGDVLEKLTEASVKAQAPLPRPLNPARALDLALLQRLAGQAPDRWSRVDWLGRGLLDPAAVRSLPTRQPELWSKVLSDSLLSRYPAPSEAGQIYAFRDADREAIARFLETSAEEFGAEATLDHAFYNPRLIAQPVFRAEVLKAFPALAKEIPVHRIKGYCTRVLEDGAALDRLFAFMREKARNAADLMAIVDPELREANWPNEAVKEAYLQRLLKIGDEEEARYEKFARSEFQKHSWRELLGRVRGGGFSEGRMPASLAAPDSTVDP